MKARGLACSDFPLAESEVTLSAQTTEIKSAYCPPPSDKMSVCPQLFHLILFLAPDVYVQGIKMSPSQLSPLELSTWYREESTIFDTI